MEALNVRPQVLVVEEYIKEPSVLFVGGLELLELLLGIRNRGYHAVVTDYRFTRAYSTVKMYFEDCRSQCW